MFELSFNRCLGPAVLAAGLCIASGLAAAAPASYSFSQGQFSGGGALSGTFAGEDLNNDGQLSLGELTAFSLTFSGDSLVPGLISRSLSDLDVFYFDLAGSLLGDGSQEGLETLDVVVSSGLGVLGQMGTRILDPDPQSQAFSESAVGVSVRQVGAPPRALPQPATWALLPLGLLAALPRRRRQCSAATLPKLSLKVNSSET